MISTPFMPFSRKNLFADLDSTSMKSGTFWNSPGNFGGAWQVMALIAQRNSATVLFSFIYAIRRAGPQ
jgi:hypothetical protein